MGGVATASPVYAKFMAVEHDKENTIRINRMIYPACQSTNETKNQPYKEGERVWLEGTYLKLPYRTMKLAPRRYGPFHITAKISDVAYHLKILEKWKIHNVFHASLLTP